MNNYDEEEEEIIIEERYEDYVQNDLNYKPYQRKEQITYEYLPDGSVIEHKTQTVVTHESAPNYF